ncbi:MAG TPA: hypothetical protein VFS71_00105 [Flavobacterium sp.]|uniref:hypothetical protein n=1 Tax=Flavobacterium sp. TaxID=239 RepID=UPI002DBB05DD|nr:hypothetical protein [Flavobacterium sp.]HEU4788066.1 hypothetical protein [Flavobacterium sp.]
MKIITLFLICATFTRCSPIYYVPNTQNVPVIKNKGQTNIQLTINSSESTEGTELQGAYGITDEIALQLNADWVKSSESSSYGSGKFIEFGPGYYRNISEHFVFETYGLLGFGSLKYEEDINTPQEINASFTRFGLQPSISFSSKYFNASLSSRFANLNYNSVSGNLYDVDYLKANNSYWLIEPALTLQGGLENIKLQIQFQYSNNLTNSNFSQDYALFSLGLKITLNPKKY